MNSDLKNLINSRKRIPPGSVMEKNTENEIIKESYFDVNLNNSDNTNNYE
jgi:hypothetical protein